jgi:CheY-like chemotaxis protein
MLEILLVEDNLGDVRLMKEALKDSGFHGHLSVVEDGDEALEFLRRRGEYAHAQRPHLIFLDLKLPRKSGWEVLGEIELDDDLRRIPVIVLTTSASHEDVDLAYRLNASSYVTKPHDIEGFVRMLSSIQYFWTSVYFWSPSARTSVKAASPGDRQPTRRSKATPSN